MKIGKSAGVIAWDEVIMWSAIEVCIFVERWNFTIEAKFQNVCQIFTRPFWQANNQSSCIALMTSCISRCKATS